MGNPAVPIYMAVMKNHQGLAGLSTEGALLLLEECWEVCKCGDGVTTPLTDALSDEEAEDDGELSAGGSSLLAYVEGSSSTAPRRAGSSPQVSALALTSACRAQTRAARSQVQSAVRLCRQVLTDVDGSIADINCLLHSQSRYCIHCMRAPALPGSMPPCLYLPLPVLVCYCLPAYLAYLCGLSAC